MTEVVGLVLAAGCGTRFGHQNKLLAELRKRPLILHTLHSMQICDRLVIVVRYDDTPLINLLESISDLPQIDIVFNHNTKMGMAYSIICGLKACLDAHAWCIVPGDMPYINPETVSRLVAQLRDNSNLVAPYFAGKRGHPVGFGRKHLPQLLALSGEHGAKPIIESHIMDLKKITTDDAGILEDVDTPAQLNLSK